MKNDTQKTTQPTVLLKAFREKKKERKNQSETDKPKKPKLKVLNLQNKN